MLRSDEKKKKEQTILRQQEDPLTQSKNTGVIRMECFLDRLSLIDLISNNH